MKPSYVVSAFTFGNLGGNPSPVVLDADNTSEQEMLAFAYMHKLECVFTMSPISDDADHRFRFFVPNHEMEMCGHGTIAGVWALHRAGRINSCAVTIETLSGMVRGVVSPDTGCVRVSQPPGCAEDVCDRDEICAVLHMRADDLSDRPIQNACTSRVKTLVPVRDPQTLNGLSPDFGRIRGQCLRLGSTGLYPYAPDEGKAGLYHARQFPADSGYREDPATGIAAAALAYGLRAQGEDGRITVRQGQAMGRPSEIVVEPLTLGSDGFERGCWIGGSVREETHI